MYEQNQRSYVGEASGRLPDGPSLAPKRETLHSTLAETVQVLAECDGIMRDIANKMSGPIPENNSVNQTPPPGVSGVAMEVRNRAQQIRSALGQLAQEIG